MKSLCALLVISLCLCLASCGEAEESANASSGDVVADAGADLDTVAASDNHMTADLEGSPTYAFDDEDGASTISHSGQTARHVLILELTGWLGGLTAAIDANEFEPTSVQEVLDEIDFYMDFDGASDGDYALNISLHEGLNLQEGTMGELSTSTQLSDKVAGNDTTTDHKDWATDFAGWDGVTSPDDLLDAWFTKVGENALARANGELDWDVHLTAEGHDLMELIQKFLTMAITFHQGTDDYLDDDVEEKGLLTPNVLEEGKSYSNLAHAWDEGFGYFGAPKDYASYTDDEIASKDGRLQWQGHHDSDGDAMIALGDEYCWGASLNAAKRDRGSSEAAPTDMTGEIFSAFVAGRELIASVEGALSEEEMELLKGHRDTVVGGWERATAATVVHYLNDVIGDMAKIGSDDYLFVDHAKHWGELKGFALGLQFSPHSPLSDAQFVSFHGKVGTAPVLEGGDLGTYKAALLEAREIVAAAYGFDASNVGDDNGENGW